MSIKASVIVENLLFWSSKITSNIVLIEENLIN